MYTGRLRLDFENQIEEAHSAAEVLRCIILEEELKLEFSGHDEGHHFTGNCVLIKSDAGYAGVGSFVYAGEKVVSSRVVVKLEKDGSEVSLHGTWRDQGEAEPYQLEVELSES